MNSPLPASPTEISHTKAAAQRPVVHPRLLVIDDEADVRRLVRDFFDGTEWQVDTAGTIDEGVRCIGLSTYPVIVCDVHMPGHGPSITSAAQQRRASTQIIMFTGSPTVETVQEAIRNGAYDYLAKPCSADEMRRIVQRAYDRCLLLEERDWLERQNLEYARQLETLLEARTVQLRASELKYRAIFNRSVDAILLVDPDTGCICDYNIAAARMLNINGPGLNGRPIRDFTGDRLDVMLTESRAPGHGEWRFERVHFRGEDGWDRTAQVAAGKIEFEGKSYLHLVARDVTDHIELRERHERMELELLNEQRLAAIGLLVSGVAHNINTPLTGIYGAAQLIKLKHPDVEDIDGVISQVERINGIIRNLMWKSRQEQDLSFQELDLCQLLMEELRFLEADLDFKHNVERRFDFADNVPTIMGRYSDFSMSLMNIVRNALDAMHGRPNRVLAVEMQVRDGDIRFTVRDNGCGIPPEIRAKIFMPFFTTKPLASGEKSAQPTGTGLGLSTVQKLMGPYGARYDIESEVGVGTSFTISLPLALNAASARRQGLAGALN